MSDVAINGGARELVTVDAGVHAPPAHTHGSITAARGERTGVGATCCRAGGCRLPPHVRALLLNNAILLVSEASRGIVLATQFSFISSLTGGGDAARTAASASVALFSIGRLVANMGLGWAADRWPVRSVLAAALAIHAVGQLLYAFAGGLGGVPAILAARLIIGYGSGTLGVNRAFAAAMVPTEDRTRQFSFLGTSKFVGYALTPFLGQVIGGSGGGVPGVSAYASSGLLMAAAAAALAVATLALLPSAPWSGGSSGGGSPGCDAGGDWRAARDAAASRLAGCAALARSPSRRRECCRAWSTPVAVAGLIFVAINLVSKGALTMVEAIMSADFQLAFRDDDGDMIIDTEEYVTVLGVGGLALYMFMVAKPNRRSGVPPSAVPASTGSSINGAAPARPTAASQGAEGNCWRRSWQRLGPDADPWLLIGSLALTGLGAALASPAANASRLAVMTTGFVLIWSVGAPIADILAASMYSVIVSEVGGKNGSAMGAITAAGSVGRILFPLVFGIMSHAGTLWLAAGACFLCAGLAWAYFHRFSRGLYCCCRRDAGHGAESFSGGVAPGGSGFAGAPDPAARDAGRGRSAGDGGSDGDDSTAHTTALLSAEVRA